MNRILEQMGYVNYYVWQGFDLGTIMVRIGPRISTKAIWEYTFKVERNRRTAHNPSIFDI